jgi:hypothetical protein
MMLLKDSDSNPILYLIALIANLCENVFKLEIWLFIKIDGANKPNSNLVTLHALFTNIKKSAVVLPLC